jgi:hypothetical protein
LNGLSQQTQPCAITILNAYFFMLPDEQASPEQIAALRAIPGEQRLLLAEQLYWAARKMKAAGVRDQHPDWSEDQINEQVRQIFLNART